MAMTEEETKWSPVGFEAPDPELDNSEVVCAGCGETAPVSEMGVTADNKVERDGAVLEVTRHYLHSSEDCMLRFLETDADRSEGGEADAE